MYRHGPSVYVLYMMLCDSGPQEEHKSEKSICAFLYGILIGNAKRTTGEMLHSGHVLGCTVLYSDSLIVGPTYV